MKRKIFFSVCFLAMFAIVWNGCKEDGDTTRPVINLIEPAEGDTLQIGDDVHFEAEFSDDEALASYKVNIHPDFDGHTHTRSSDGETVDFEKDWSWTVSGRNTSIHHHEIEIPENATPGDYHLMVYCTDVAGNESHIALNVVLSHEAGENHDHEDEEHDE
ncbi:MAG: DUF4625 domain-containing protein [Dysgonamonadaceae bacterium]|jgi:hypothetical protein|nr:DUF4625 domain-containing protein [Dysgonamonadaceae bacterium]